MMAIFDEPFLLDCLNDLNLSYFVNQSSDPLSVIAGESIPPEGILARYFGSQKKHLKAPLVFTFEPHFLKMNHSIT